MIFGVLAIKYIWIIVFIVTLVWSGYQPKDQLTWFLEVSPAMIGMVVLVVTWRSFRLTTLVYILILFHSIVLMIGGHYTYAEVPLFDDFKTWFGFERNNYDKLGHIVQGFVPAMIAREILIRNAVINGKIWMNFFILCFCLGFSAFYELIEWWVALLSEEAADAFLGTQGYAWDTQSDMWYALLGAAAALLLLSHYHDKQMQALSNKT